jgi:hypothetical protein
MLSVCPAAAAAVALPADFSQQLSEFDSRSGIAPSSIAWCGVDAVALRWEGLLLLVGPYGDWLKRPCQGAAVMVTEVDGLRMVNSSTCSLLRRVPDALVQVWYVGCLEIHGCCRSGR